MLQKRSQLLWGLLFYTFGFATAQPLPTPCGSNALLEQNLAEYPERQMDIEALEQFTEQQSTLSDAAYRQTATIPVVVHVVWLEEADNISEALIHSQIEVLNQDFQKRNEDRIWLPEVFAPLAASVGLEFCLASIDPQGAATTGIVRRQSNVDCIGNAGSIQVGGRPRLFYDDLGGSDAWDTERYLNIWVAPNCNAFLGVATFPESALAEEDGVVIDPLYFGVRSADSPSYPFHLGKTTTHEVGHYFNLQHLWGSGGCNSDDRVDDTPAQEEEYRDCPIHPISSCGSPDMFMNFMNYVDDECLQFFTKGQKARIWAALESSRKGLLENSVCQFPEPVQTPPLSLFPNPARDCIHLLLDAPQSQTFQVLLLDAAGREVYRSAMQTGELKAIELEGLSAGIYFVQVVLEKVVYSRKVLVLANSL